MLNSIKRFVRSSKFSDAAPLYTAIVNQSRQKVFYEKMGVPDTLDGRFEIISLHMFLVLHRLKDEAGIAGFSQQLFDLFFADMDVCLREMGVGDMGIGHRIKDMAQSFYGRLKYYEDALGDDSKMVQVLKRNVYGTVSDPCVDALKDLVLYAKKMSKILSDHAINDIVIGNIEFGNDFTS